MKAFRKVWAGLMAVIMIASLLPTTPVFAAENEEGWATDYSAYFYYVGDDLVKANSVDKTVEPATCIAYEVTTYVAKDADGAVIEGSEKVIIGTEYADHVAAEAVNENEDSNPATCTEDGSYDEVVYCDVCGEQLTRDEKTVEATGHVEGEVVIENIVDPTCTEDGSYEENTYCTVCGDLLSSKEIALEATGHVFDELVEVLVEPDCVTSGKGTFACDCGEEAELVIPATGHTPIAKAIEENVVPATCEDEGSYDAVYYCVDCDKELDRVYVTMEALGHTWGEPEVIVEPTCAAVGTNQYTCEVCDATKTEDIDALEHEYGWVLRRDASFLEATCYSEGHKMFDLTCKNCGDIAETEEVVEDYTDHTWKVTEVITAPTCTEDGEGYVTCTVCGYTPEETVVLAATGHTEKEAVAENVVEPTCTEEGSYDSVVYCAVCDAEVSRVNKIVDVVPHTEVVDEAVAPTCTEAGLTEGSHCEICEAVIVEQEVVDALGHDWGVAYDIDDPTKPAGWVSTCSTPGREIEECARCKEHRATDLELDPENHEDIVVDEAVAPTCTEAGLTEGSHCAACGVVIVEQEEIAPAHTWVLDEENSIAVTCEEDGLDAFVCSVCEETMTEVVEKLGHEMVPGAVVTKPTCEEPGEAYFYCVRVDQCGKREAELDEMPALGHDFHAVSAEVFWNNDEANKGWFEYTVVCANDPTHTHKTVQYFEYDEENVDENGVTACTENGVTIEVSREITKDATCEEYGEYTYTATANIATYTEEESEDSGANFLSDDEEIIVTGSNVETENEDLAPLGHDYESSKPVKENEIAPACEEDGSYETVIYCSRCGEELSRAKVTVPALGHAPAGKSEVIVQGTDVINEVTKFTKYCTVCDKVLHTRTRVTNIAHGHVPALDWEIVAEESYDATCTEDGLEVWALYCLNDGEELDRYEIVLDANGHEAGEVVIENEVTPEYVCAGSHTWEEVTYCTVCGEELTRVEVEVEAAAHKGFYTETEISEAACLVGGTKTDITYCGICFVEVSRQVIEIPANGHVEAEEVCENVVEATCTEAGSYDVVVYCDTCGEELARETVAVEALGHTAAEAVCENVVEATCTMDGSYDVVTKCEVCGEELTRETVTVEHPGHKIVLDAAVEPTIDAPGLTEGSHCAVCDEVIIAQTEVYMNGWVLVDGDWYYLVNGEKTTGWAYVAGKWYFMDDNGVMQTGWVLVGGEWYYLNSAGQMQTGWNHINGKWYFLKATGAMATGWVQSNGNWYYLASSGAMTTGWVYVNGMWYYMASSGAMVTGWVSVNGSWYYLNSAGQMQTGWILQNGTWYYLNNNGAMVTGIQFINGVEYHFNTNGAWIE